MKVDYDSIELIRTLSIEQPQMPLAMITDIVNKRRKERNRIEKEIKFNEIENLSMLKMSEVINSNERNVCEIILEIQHEEEEMKRNVEEEIEKRMTISQTTVQNIIKKNNISLKQMKVEPERRNDEKRIESRRILFEHYLFITSLNFIIVYIDEIGMNINQRKNRSRSIKGRAASVTTFNLNSLNITGICMQIAGDNIVFKLTERNSNRIFLNTVRDLFIPYLKQNVPQNCLVNVVIDNASVHKSKVCQLFNNSGIYVTYNTAYSPMLNSIEHSFNSSKTFLHHLLSNEFVLNESINLFDSLETFDENFSMKLFAISLFSVSQISSLNFHLKTLEFIKLSGASIPLENDSYDTSKIKRFDIEKYFNNLSKIVSIKNLEYFDDGKFRTTYSCFRNDKHIIPFAKMLINI